MPAARAAALVILAAVAVPAAAKDAALAVRTAWSRPAAAGGTAAGYMTLINRGQADALVGAESPLAGRVELHASSMAGGMMRMSAEPRIALPPGGEVSFAPGGRHLMFVGVKRALRAGDRLPATLRFASGRKLPVEFSVTPGTPPASAQAPGMGETRHKP